MKLEITDSPLSFLNNSHKKTFKIKIIRGILKFLEKYFGSQLLIKIPLYLQKINKINPEIFKLINFSNKCQELNIIKTIIKGQSYPDELFAYNFYTISSSSPYGNGNGIDLLNEENAIWKSLGEVIERYFWYNSDHFFKNKIKAPYKDMKNISLNIFSLAGFTEEQKNNIPFLKFNENTIFNWTKIYSLTQKKKIFCPIQLISSLYVKKNLLYPEKNASKIEPKTEPMLRWCITTGLAAGQSLEEAIVKGILEVIERDAFMISYLNKLSPPLIDLEYLSAQDEEIAKIVKNFKRYNLEIYALKLPTDFSEVHIIAALIIDRSGLGPALSVGASANFNFKNCLLSSISEALGVRNSMKNKFNSEIDFNNINREGRVLYWAKKENLHKINFFLKGEYLKIDIEKNMYVNKKMKNYYKNKLKFLINKLKQKNYEASYIELTPKNIVKKINIRSTQVIIPELQPLHLEESIPYLGGKRLKEVPLKLGYQPAKILNQIPHPFP
ncbi:MAG: YcaO-like family protein [Patescibacteria group bacterium]